MENGTLGVNENDWLRDFRYFFFFLFSPCIATFSRLARNAGLQLGPFLVNCFEFRPSWFHLSCRRITLDGRTYQGNFMQFLQDSIMEGINDSVKGE